MVSLLDAIGLHVSATARVGHFNIFTFDNYYYDLFEQNVSTTIIYDLLTYNSSTIHSSQPLIVEALRIYVLSLSTL